MKTANVYEIERALQQPITPQQRQQAATNNPIAALMAQRLDGAENSLRTKMQTPPPPQGTVMNQYYQWPQQQEQQMGLAQPGLEQTAQQYAAGGLVAFANGGLASMLPMGYAGESDVPVFNYDGGEEYGDSHDVRGFADGSVVRGVFPYTSGYGDLNDDELDAMIEAETEAEANPQLEESYSAGPGDIGGMALKGLKSAGSWLADKAFIKDPNWEARQVAKAQAEKDYYKTTEPSPSKKRELMGVAPIPTAPEKPSFIDNTKGVLAAVGEMLTPDKTKPVDTGAVKAKQPSAPKASTVRSIPEPKPVPKEAPKSDERPGVSLLSPDMWQKAGLGGVNAPSAADDTTIAYVPDEETPDTAQAQQMVQKVTNSGLSADQQIAAIAKYLQTDTSEAMKIKGEMEKANAHAGNLGIMASLASAVGLGLGTYGPASHRWGAGLAGLASGLMGVEQADESRQAKLNELRMKVAEAQGSGQRKAAEMVLNQRAKAAAEADEMKKQLMLEKVKGGYGLQKAEIGAGATRYSADQRAEAAALKAAGGGGGMNEYQRKQIEAKAVELGMKEYEQQILGKQPDENLRARLIAKYYQQLLNGGGIAPSVSPASRGSFVGGQFTPYQ